MQLLPPVILLVALLAWSAVQIARDVTQRPDYQTRGGVPVVLVERDGPPPAGDHPTCWPAESALEAELPELIPLAGRLSNPPCGRPLPEAVVLEAWDGGRFVWWPGERVALERW